MEAFDAVQQEVMLLLAQCFSGSVACLDSNVMGSFPLTEGCSTFAKAEAGLGAEM